MSTKAGQQQVAIVTGASSGLGLGITRALLQRGFRVVANSRRISKSKELKPSPDLILVDGDIGIKETALKVAEAAVSHFGCIDLLVNNAGVYNPKPFTEYTSEDFETNIHVNVGGYFYVTQQAVAQMRVVPCFGFLCATFVFSVSPWFVLLENHHRGTENTEVAQRSSSNQGTTQMRKQKSGHIVSISAVVVDQPLAGWHMALPVITKSVLSIGYRSTSPKGPKRCIT